MNIHELIENAEFGEMFVTKDHSRALFCRTCENSEYKMADFYVEGWGMIRVNRENGHVLSCNSTETSGFNDIVGKA
jgi:hypothetical protein